MQSGIDISPADRQEWRMFCCALKVLGYSEQDFISLSSGAERDSRQAWRAERNPSRYKTEDGAKGMIVELAKSAGVEVKQFLLSRNQDTKPSRYHDRPRTSATSRTAPTRPTPTPTAEPSPRLPEHGGNNHRREPRPRYRSFCMDGAGVWRASRPVYIRGVYGWSVKAHRPQRIPRRRFPLYFHGSKCCGLQIVPH